MIGCLYRYPWFIDQNLFTFLVNQVFLYSTFCRNPIVYNALRRPIQPIIQLYPFADLNGRPASETDDIDQWVIGLGLLGIILDGMIQMLQFLIPDSSKG